MFPDGTGVPIGSPLGSLISEIFMKRYEEELFSSNHHLLQHVVYWYRYVDDVLCLWNGTIPDLQDFITFLNNLYPTIKFTLEIGGGEISFLDLRVSIEQNTHTFGIFRKETSTDLTIHGSSYCPPSHKFAAFNCMIHRLISVPLSSHEFQKELSIIKHLANVNRVKINIDNIVRRKLVKKALDATTSLPRTLSSKRKLKWIRIPYLGPLTSSLARVLKQFNFQPAFYNFNTLSSNICNLKDPIPTLEKSGVYKLTCSDCPAIYIGETERQLKIRVSEHIEAYTSNLSKRKSAFAEHLLNCSHTFKGEGAVLLHVENSFRRRRALEDIEIIRHIKDGTKNVINKYVPENGLLEKVYSYTPDS